jgi:aminoglycoside 6'-N-acetyltransferase I
VRIYRGDDGRRSGRICEISIRAAANGCDSRPVPFLEGIWIEAQFRRRALGAQLIAHIEAFITARGFREIGSDAPIENRVSHAAHRRWGFSETERAVYFRKVLTTPAAK